MSSFEKSLLILLVAVLSALVSSTRIQAVGLPLILVVNDNRDLPDASIDGICDAEPGTHACTLRAAVDEINARGGKGHRILIGSLVITLAPGNGPLTLNAGVGVSVWGAGVTRTIIDGSGPSRNQGIFTIPANAVLDIRRLALTNGFASCCGGGILNGGGLYVANALLSGHHATSSGVGGPAGMGAAIFNQAGAYATIVNSTLSNNQSRGSGGAIRNEGHLIVTASTFEANDGFAGGGGALANNGRAFLYNDTFSGNHSAGAGAIWNTAAGKLQGLSLTFSENFTHTGGPWNTLQNDVGAVLALQNSIVTASQSGTNCLGPLTSFGFNLSNDSSCGFIRQSDWQDLDPTLGPLAGNGGPTETHALLPGSPAIDRGFCFGVDQRGFHRPVNIIGVPNTGNGCDIGAFEVQRWEK
jgi:hypothetical protein